MVTEMTSHILYHSKTKISLCVFFHHNTFACPVAVSEVLKGTDVEARQLVNCQPVSEL